jgi:hypothetical protein
MRVPMADVEPNFLSRQIERLVSDIAGLRDDMRVLTANGDRQDSTLTRLLDEMRAVYAQVARMGDRIRKMEET